MTEAKKRGRPKIENKANLNIYDGSKQEKLDALHKEWIGCMRCPLGEFRNVTGNQNIVFGAGNPEADIMIIGEAPGEQEERFDYPFIGESGKLLNSMLSRTSEDPIIVEAVAEFSKDPKTGRAAVEAEDKFHDTVNPWRHHNFFITNTVACRPPENRTPTPNEVKACWERLWNTIYIVDPRLIITAGSTAISAVVMKTNAQKVSKAHGEVIDVEYEGRVRKLKYPVLPIAHPAYLLRKADYKAPEGEFKRTIKELEKAMTLVRFLRQQHGDPRIT